MSRKIKSIKRYNQNYKSFVFSDMPQSANEEYLEMEIFLDENGNAKEELKYTVDSVLEEKNSYEFNSNGKLLSHELLYAIDDISEKRVYNRNDKGFLVSEIKYYGSDSGERTEYEYNDKNNVTAIVNYDEEGQFISREEITYDEKDNLIQRKTLDSDGRQVLKVVFTPPDNNQIDEIEYNSKDEIVSSTIIKFHENGKELSTVQTNPQGKLITSIINTYDDRGNIIEKINKDYFSKKIKYEYNDKDLLITQELFDDNGMLLRKNMFEYDDEGHVIAEQTYEMDTTRGGRDKHFGTRYEYVFY